VQLPLKTKTCSLFLPEGIAPGSSVLYLNGSKLQSKWIVRRKSCNLHDDKYINGVIVFTKGTWNEAIIVRVDNR
jgi:hypothetical protein